MSRRRFTMRPPNSSFALNITSMTDMFTILLVFLLQTYSTSDVQIIPQKDIRLPISSVETNPVKALNISVSRKELKIEGRTIASLQDGDFVGKDTDKNDTNFITPLFSELSKIEKEGVVAQDSKGAPDKAIAKEGKIMMQADSTLSYSTIRKIMYTASMAGFPKLKLATVAGE